MGGFAKAIRERVRVARAAVAAAYESGDAYEVAVAQDELDEMLRLARINGVHPDGEPEISASDGS
ncbi:hypothetical protein AB0I10_18675 [Streptomyces sp. NPDC050636]|uniref:hypothetical protein n=1 Tax=Streptomyces sp. NPDC050636 TaxID=3154510 RepID=UPI003418AA7F